MPLLPLVTGYRSRPSAPSRSRTRSATWAHSCSPAGAPGSRSMTSRSGLRRLAVAVDGPLGHVQLERVEVDQVGELGEVVDQRVGDVVDRHPRQPATGRPDGRFFSKNIWSPTPCGQRTRVTGAVGEVRQQHRRDLGVVVEHLALGRPGRRVHHLVEAGQLAACARRPRRGSPRARSSGTVHLLQVARGSGRCARPRYAGWRSRPSRGQLEGARLDDDAAARPRSRRRRRPRHLVAERRVGRA